MAEQSHTKYYKEVIYKGDSLEISSFHRLATRKELIALLKNNPLSRSEIIKATGWTRGQIAGLLNRGQRDGVFYLQRGKVYLS